MDLGITGKKAIVCASSRGLGFACAEALVQEGCHVILNGRDEGRTAAAAARLGPLARACAADLDTQAGREALLAACPDADILVTNNAGPAPIAWDAWTDAQMMAALESNLLAAAALIRAVVPGMQARQFGRIINITSAMVKSPHPYMILSTAPRAGLTALAKALSRDVASDNVTINNLLPERFETERQAFMIRRSIEVDGISEEEARRRIVSTIAAGRMGRPEEFGAACAFLCSSQAGYISGQNLQMDGGSYVGLI